VNLKCQDRRKETKITSWLVFEVCTFSSLPKRKTNSPERNI